MISSTGNPFLDLAFSFNLTVTDILKRDIVPKKGYSVGKLNQIFWSENGQGFTEAGVTPKKKCRVVHP